MLFCRDNAVLSDILSDKERIRKQPGMITGLFLYLVDCSMRGVHYDRTSSETFC